MGSRTRAEKFLPILALFILSRIFQLSLGFGLDGDAWSVAAVAKKIAGSWGCYEASRLPGYPIPEHLFALAFKVLGFGFLRSNLVALVFGIFSVIGMWKLSKALNADPLLAAFALAFHPIFWVASTTTMDYIFGTCFVTWALYFYIKDRLLISGALFGLACGSRIMIAIGIIAFILDMLRGRKKSGAIAEWLAAFAVVSALSFAPVFSTYGRHFFSYTHTKINLLAAAYRLLHEFFGVPFLLGFLILFTAKLLRGEKSDVLNKKFILWALFISLWLPYLRFPLDPSYLSCAIGVGILLLASYFPKCYFRFLALLILASSLVSLFTIDRYEYREHNHIKVKFLDLGPALSDTSWRATLYETGLRLAKDVDSLPDKSVYVMVDLFFHASWDILGKDRWENVPFIYRHKLFVATMPKEFLKKFEDLGWQIYYFDGTYADYQTRRSFGYSLDEFNAKPLKFKNQGSGFRD